METTSLTTDGIFNSDHTTEDVLDIKLLASSYVMHKLGKNYFSFFSLMSICGCSNLTMSDSEYILDGITNPIEGRQILFWHFSRKKTKYENWARSGRIHCGAVNSSRDFYVLQKHLYMNVACNPSI